MKIQIGPLFRNSLLMLALVVLCPGASAQILAGNSIEPHVDHKPAKPITRFMDYEVFTCLKPPVPGGFNFNCLVLEINNQNQHDK